MVRTDLQKRLEDITERLSRLDLPEEDSDRITRLVDEIVFICEFNEREEFPKAS